ncbi:flagellar hook-length control protein FliK [Butyrivibrio sp. LB2008]|uniref:flagellar hook-length control protein FliK n=1 Tax=Butyrivibrio sp. LB2008 TaxID=1408305 RepID=UPI000478C855|nr:flagellar hook-length control protein FliK [Butyrivibrio sp. LB2008]
MGSATNSISAAMNFMAGGTAASNVSAVTMPEGYDIKGSASFDNILNKANDALTQINTSRTQKDVSVPNEKAKTNVSEQKETAGVAANNVKSDTTDTGTVDTKSAVVTEETSGKEAGKELQEAIAEEGKKLITQIAEELDISEEDIVNAMQVLGITAADLFNPDNLIQLVTAVGGQDEAVNLITDSELYTSLQDLMEGADSMRSELMNELNLTEEDFNNAVSQIHEEFSQVTEKVAEPDTQSEPVIEINDLRQDKDIENPADKEQGKEIKNDISTDRADVVKEEFKPVENSNNTTKNNNQSANYNHGSEGATVFNQFLNGVTDAINGTQAADEMLAYTDRAQMENIVRQITEKITVSSTEDVTKMELQLHPASLGNVNILLTSGKDGIVARFTAQNEIVKEAVESQMLQLQQKFEAHGIKVTSIEVTVSSHAFEENLQQQGGSSGNNEQASKGRKGLRRINLLDADDIAVDTEMDDAERISAQMMAMSGNTVDFSA